MFFKVLVMYVLVIRLSLSAPVSDSFCDSKILDGLDNYHDQIIKWLPKNSEWDVCYRASRDGWSANNFHTKCNDKGPTLIIIQVGQYIFGGYTDASWARHGLLIYKSAPNSFIFSLRNKDKLKPFKAPLKDPNTINAIEVGGSGPRFGSGPDLSVLSEQFGSAKSGFTNFGVTYRPPPGYPAGGAKTNQLLAGSFMFTASEIEVYHLVQ